MTQKDLQKMADMALIQVGMTYEMEKYVKDGNDLACYRLYKAGIKQYYDYHKVMVKAYYLSSAHIKTLYQVYQEKDADIEIAKGVYAKDIFAPDDNFGVIHNDLLEMLRAIANEVPVSVKLGFCYRHPFKDQPFIILHEGGKAIDIRIDFGEDWMDECAKIYTILKDGNFKFYMKYSKNYMHIEVIKRIAKKPLSKYHTEWDCCLGDKPYRAWITVPNKNPLFVRTYRNL